MTGPQRDRGADTQPGRRFTQPRLAAWLGGKWIADGPPVCVVEGFSGLGKSHLARQVRDGYPHASAYVAIADTHTSFEDFLLKTQGRLKSEADIGIPVGADTASAVERALRGDLLLVVDDFQNCLAPGTHELTRQFADFFGQVGSRRAGRLLLLTSQSVDEDQCQELGIVQRTLVPLAPEDGGALLLRLLTARDRQYEVPADRIVELAQWLGSNPRAMQALVAALRFAPLSELVGTEPDAAEIGYRHVAEPLVANLEKQFVQRTMDRLAPAELALLKRLSVHRKSFGREAINLAHTDVGGDVQQPIQELVDHFFLEHHRSEYTLNPTARELALWSVLRNRQATRTAHRYAADFYLRHFKAKSVKPIALADKFMEARHHLHLAGRTAELRELAQTFALHLQRSAMSQPIPEDPDELDEQILLLDAALEQGSPSSLLNLRLARMLLRRGRDDDASRALGQTTEAIAIPPASEHVWQLHLQLVHQAEGLDALLPLVERARAELPATTHTAILMTYIPLLRRAQRDDEALKLVLDIIEAGPDRGGDRESLYVQAIKMLTRAGQVERVETIIASALAERGASTAVHASAALYQACIEFYASRGNYPAAVALLDEALQRVPPESNLAALYHAGIELHLQRGDREAAIRLLDAGIARIAPEQQAFVVYQAGIGLHARCGDDRTALALLDEGMRRLPVGHSTLSTLTIGMLIHVRRGDLDAAMRLGFQGLAMRQNPVLIESLLLTVHRFVQRPDTAARAWQWWDEIDQRFGLGAAVLSQVLRLITAGSWAEAAEVATRSRQEGAATAAVVRQEALAFLAAGDLAAAARAAAVIDLSKVRKGSDGTHGRAQSWLVALVHALRGEDAEAWRLIAEDWDVEPGGDPVATCVELWQREFETPRPLPSTFFPVLPKEITGMAEDLVHPSVFRPGTPPEAVPDERRGPAVLALATEWSSAHGGLSTLNRQLCRALAAQGAEVVCMVLGATDAERRDAEAEGVTLRVAVGPPGGSEQAALSGRTEIPAGFEPDYIIGHSRVTGPAAYQLAEHFPKAKRLHVIHMAADEIEWHKPDRADDAGERSEKRRQTEIELARTAHRTVAIGPRLYNRYLRDLSRFDTTRVVCLVPGFDIADDRPRTPPPGEPWTILVAGRTEDDEIKGLDIAARAVALAVRNRSAAAPRLELLVRGAPQGESEPLRRKLLAWAGLPSLDVVVRPYSTDRDGMVGDVETSTLVLMPSRKEGFGLVGLEAITAGVPVLVSGSSGLGEHLRSVLEPRDADRVVVPMSGDLDTDADRWSVAISAALYDVEAAFARAAALRTALAARNTWSQAAAELLASL